MRDHRRILGSLFMAWAVVQAVGMSAVTVLGGMPAEAPAWTVLRWAFLALALVIYFWVGRKLRAHDPRVRTYAIAFSALALLSFPLGTALGIYGLWVLLRWPKEATA